MPFLALPHGERETIGRKRHDLGAFILLRGTPESL